jgi:hypothetical protein
MRCLAYLRRSNQLNRRLLSVLALALCLTLLNALKPLHMDDGGYYCYARQIAQEPTSPYGFTMLFDGVPRPAIEIPTPPVVPYWWALGIRLFGDQPVLWKLWLFPINLLLVHSLSTLLHRFARRSAVPLLWMTVLSPTLLPGVNLMTDVPALAIGLFAFTLFLRACDRNQLALAVLAGLTAGVAMQTKYTAFVMPAVMLLFAFLHRRTWMGLVAASLAALVFVAFEGFLVLRHGESHFLRSYNWFHHPGTSWTLHAVRMLSKLPWLAGSLAPALLLLGLAALGWPIRRVVLAGVVIVVADLAVLGLAEEQTWLLWSPETGRPLLTLSHLVDGALGVGLCVTMLAVGWQLMRRARSATAPGPTLSPWRRLMLALQDSSGRVERFLMLWLGLELVGYAVVSPFAAARRILALVLVATLLAGRLAARTCCRPRQKNLLWAAAGVNVFLGLLIFGVDLLEARAAQQTAEQAAHSAMNHAEGTNCWYVGSFSYYGERAGLKNLVLDQTLCRPGDRLVVAGSYFLFHPDLGDDLATRLEQIDEIRVADRVPLRTVLNYYCGCRALTRLEGPRATARVYRVTADLVLGTAPEAAQALATNQRR